MTISSENVQNRYNGNGVTTVFAYSFKVIDEDHLSVVIADADDVQTTLTISTHYTVSGVGVDGGGNVTTTDLTSITGSVQLPSGWSTTSETNAATSETNAAASESSVAANASAAATSEANAATSETNAAASAASAAADAVSTAADAVSTAADAASTAADVVSSAASAAAASTSETNAATSETNAAASAAAALASETAAAASAATIPTIGAGDARKVININDAETGYEKSGVEITADDIVDLPQQSSTPSTPSSGRGFFYPKNDGLFYTMNDAGVETAIGSGAGDIDFLSLKAFSDFSTYDDGAVDTPVDGTGGTPSAISITAETVSPIDTTGNRLNLKISKSAADGQGEGCSVDFTTRGEIDSYRKQIVSVFVKSSTDYADDDIGIWLYDKDNSTLIPSMQRDIKATSYVSGQLFEFQTSDADDYRLIFHCRTTNANAYDLTLTVKVGPQIKVVGTPITEWVDSDARIGASGGFTIGNGTEAAKERRSGDSVEYLLYMRIGSTTSFGGNIRGNLPSGRTIDTTKTNSFYQVIDSSITFYDNSAATGYQGNCFINGGATTYVECAVGDTGNRLTNASPVLMAQNDEIWMYFKVPLVGWGSNVEMSSIDSGREVSLLATTSNTSLTSGVDTNVVFSSVSHDTHAIYNSTTGEIIIPESGYYTFQSHLRFASDTWATANTVRSSVKVNGVVVAYLEDKSGLVAGTYQPKLSGSITLKLVKGDSVFITGFQNTGGTSTFTNSGTREYLSVNKWNGNKNLLSGEKIYAVYRTSSGQAVTNGNRIDFNTKLHDSHNAVTTGASWVFTAPRTSMYRLDYGLLTNNVAITAANQYFGVNLFAAGVGGTQSYQLIDYTQVAATYKMTNRSSILVELVKGGTLYFNFLETIPAVNLGISAASNYFSIESI